MWTSLRFVNFAKSKSLSILLCVAFKSSRFWKFSRNWVFKIKLTLFEDSVIYLILSFFILSGTIGKSWWSFVIVNYRFVIFIFYKIKFRNWQFLEWSGWFKTIDAFSIALLFLINYYYKPSKELELYEMIIWFVFYAIILDTKFSMFEF